MTIKKLIGAAALMGVMATANAASVSLVYTAGSTIDEAIADDGAILANSGDMLTFELVMDFTDIPTLGGGFDINFDTGGLSFVSYDSAGLGEPSFGRDPDVEDGRLFSGAVGAFGGITEGLIATITFMAGQTAGDYGVAPSGTDGIAGPWIDFADFITLIEPDYNGATVRVVPVPAAVWFMLSGLGALVGFGRRKAA